MDFNYDLEAALQKLPPAIEHEDNFVNARTQQVIDTLEETAKDVNADTLTKVVASLNEVVRASQKMYRDLLGQEGDHMGDGTLHGALHGTKQTNAAMNGQ